MYDDETLVRPSSVFILVMLQQDLAQSRMDKSIKHRYASDPNMQKQSEEANLARKRMALCSYGPAIPAFG